KAANLARADTHDYDEQTTRELIVDVLLREAGWTLDQPEDIEYEVTGMPADRGTGSARGFVDYVLWDDNGQPLAVVEAKRTRRSVEDGKRQAELYAGCLEEMTGQRPVIFYTNGYKTYLW